MSCYFKNVNSIGNNFCVVKGIVVNLRAIKHKLTEGYIYIFFVWNYLGTFNMVEYCTNNVHVDF